MRTASLCSLLAALVTIAACQSKPAAPVTTGGGKKVDPATTGTITGHVVFEGTPPPAETLRLGVDRACLQTAGTNAKSDAVLVSPKGDLRNVFVYIKDGVDPAYSFDAPPKSILLDQKGCHYSPRVFGVQAGQPIEIINSDNTLHNVHALPVSNQEFNKPE